jgi:hypothetical protein
MEDLTELILLQIKGITTDVGGFVAGLLSDDLTHDQQISFGHRLVDLAELILERAKSNPAIVIEGYLSDDNTEEPDVDSYGLSAGQANATIVLVPPPPATNWPNKPTTTQITRRPTPVGSKMRPMICRREEAGQ